MQPRIGILGGTGLYDLGPSEELDVETPFGNVTLQHLKFGGRETFFIPRHGRLHTVPPHRVNHRAHIEALRAARCDFVLGVNNVGALSTKIKGGSFAVLRDFADFHRGGPLTFFDDRAVHVDFSEPYCPTATAALARSTRPTLPAFVYGGTDGPRFETRTETTRLQAAGVDVVGMTGVHEATLAHERGLCYAGLVFIGNVPSARKAPTAQKIQQSLLRRRKPLLSILEKTAQTLSNDSDCRCADAARGAELTLGGR